MRKLGVILFLVGTVHVAQGKSFAPDDIVDSLLNLMSCNSNPTIGATSELVTAHRKCKEHVDMTDGRCMFPCIANELGLIAKSKLMDDEVSEYVFKHFNNLSPSKRKNWTEGIKACFNQYESRGGNFSTVYKDCHQQTDGLLRLSTCVLNSRDCAGSLANPDKLRNTMPGYKRKKRQLLFQEQVVLPMAMPLAEKVLIVGLAFGTFVSIGLSGTAIYKSQKCGTSGCYKGYCYSYCGLDNDAMDWCYTTKTFSQSFEYVKCKNSTTCNGCWKCAGSCTLG